MDRIIITHNNVDMGHGLRLCESLGVAFQDDMTASVEYGAEYFAKYERYEKESSFDCIQSCRISQLEKVFDAQKTRRRVFDVGIGCGSFLSQISKFEGWEGLEIFGWDVNPIGKSWLNERGWLFDPYSNVFTGDPVCWTLWDVLEHFRNPDEVLDRMRVGDTLLVSLPIYDDLRNEVPFSKHYRPNEHYYYFTKWGFVKWLHEYGLRVVEYNENETLPECGRQGIGTFTAIKHRQK